MTRSEGRLFGEGGEDFGFCEVEVDVVGLAKFTESVEEPCSVLVWDDNACVIKIGSSCRGCLFRVT